jgi:CopG family nickel-responsive transcriptional regulator
MNYTGGNKSGYFKFDFHGGAYYFQHEQKKVKHMEKVTRFGVSVNTNLLISFDRLIKRLGYKSRSEAFRDLIRERLVAEEWKDEEAETVGILALIFSHDTRELTEILTRIQHKHLDMIISSTHIHLDHHNCLEVIILKGQSKMIRKISDKILTTKNVKHGELITTSTGKHIS